MKRCRRAERALALAVEREEEMVPGAAIAEAWPAAVTDAELPRTLADGRWGAVLKPAVDDGRVLKVKRGRRVYYAPASRRDLRPPAKPKGRREYGAAALRCSADAVAALRAAVDVHGKMVRASDICACWFAVHGVEAPAVVAKRAKRVFGPALQDGTVRVEKLNDRNYFAPADCPGLRLPRFPTDLMRVEEALRRAVEKWRSAVLVEAVALEIDADTELSLESDLNLALHLASLIKTERAATVSSRRGDYADRYYTTLDGPRHVRAAAEHHLDKRLRAAELYWRNLGGRPFTTKALRLYAEQRPSLQFPDDPKYGWTNGLQYLEKRGHLTKITTDEDRPGKWVRGPERFVRWAPTEEWLALGEEERDRLTREDWGAARAFDEDAATDPHNPGYPSQAHDLRQLVRLAQRMEAEQFTDSTAQVIVAARPVCVESVHRAAEARRDLAPEDTDLACALREAARVRKGVRVPTLWRAGRLPGTVYFAPDESEAAASYVEFLSNRRRANPEALFRGLRELRECMQLDIARLLPLPNAVAASRAFEIWSEAEKSAAQLRQAADRAELLDDEKAAVQNQLSELDAVASQAHEAAERYDYEQEHDFDLPYEQHGIDTVRAWLEIEGLAPYEMETPRLLIGRFKHAVKTIPASPGKLDAAGRRPVERQLDRIGFACYAGLRWGGPTLVAFSAKAQNAIGDLRDPSPFIAALDGNNLADHAPAAAALGIFDDADSRAALCDFLLRVVGQHGDERPASLGAAALGAYALAPLPFGGIAQTLTPVARDVLNSCRQASWLGGAPAVAARVLRAWDEGWTRERLLHL